MIEMIKDKKLEIKLKKKILHNIYSVEYIGTAHYTFVVAWDYVKKENEWKKRVFVVVC